MKKKKNMKKTRKQTNHVDNIHNFLFREKAMAKKYYDKLFKEYCLADLSRYKENKV